jgi:hypothetical protein
MANSKNSKKIKNTKKRQSTKPQVPQVTNPEEIMSLIPYSRGSSSIIPLAYITKFHIELMLAYARHYPDSAAYYDSDKMTDELHSEICRSAKRAVSKMKGVLEILSTYDYPTDEMVKELWDDVVREFESMHSTYRTDAVQRWIEDWKHGQSPLDRHNYLDGKARS